MPPSLSWPRSSTLHLSFKRPEQQRFNGLPSVRGVRRMTWRPQRDSHFCGSRKSREKRGRPRSLALVVPRPSRGGLPNWERCGLRRVYRLPFPRKPLRGCEVAPVSVDTVPQCGVRRFHDATYTRILSTRVPASDDRVGSRRANAGIAGPGIRAVGPGDSELGAPGGSRRGPAR